MCFPYSVHKWRERLAPGYNDNMGGTTFAELCRAHTYAGCGCGMCQPGDICPTPILKIAETVPDDGLSFERMEGAATHEWKD